MGSLMLVKEAALAALVEPELDLEMMQQSDQQLMQALIGHDRVIREVFEQATILPLRFGTCFVSQTGLLEHLRAHQAEYLQKLAVLQGKAEYGLKCVPLEFSEPAVPLQATGKAYFLAKKQRYQTIAEQQQQQQAEWQQLVTAVEQRYADTVVGASTDGIRRIHLLSDRQSETSLHQDLQDWQAQCFHWTLQLGEALPPYHFV